MQKIKELRAQANKHHSALNIKLYHQNNTLSNRKTVHRQFYLTVADLCQTQLVTYIQPVSYKRYFRCNDCVLLLVYTINLSLSTDLVDPYGENTFSVKPPLYNYSNGPLNSPFVSVALEVHLLIRKGLLPRPTEVHVSLSEFE